MPKPRIRSQNKTRKKTTHQTRPRRHNVQRNTIPIHQTTKTTSQNTNTNIPKLQRPTQQSNLRRNNPIIYILRQSTRNKKTNPKQNTNRQIRRKRQTNTLPSNQRNNPLENNITLHTKTTHTTNRTRPHRPQHPIQGIIKHTPIVLYVPLYYEENEIT